MTSELSIRKKTHAGPVPNSIRLGSAEVHVWLTSIPSPNTIRRLEACLSADELSRSRGFRFQADRNQAIAARGILRSLLGAYLGTHPRKIEISYNTCGKPEVLSARRKNRIEFNVSHSEGLILIAFAWTQRVGVDIERIRCGFPASEIAERFFSEKESKYIQALEKDRRLERFFASWTTKEAYLKARGLGLFEPLDKIELIAESGEKVTKVRVSNSEEGPVTWSVVPLQLVNGYASALAVEGDDFRVSVFSWTDVEVRGGATHQGRHPVSAADAEPSRAKVRKSGE